MSDVERVRAEPPQCGAFFPPRSKECKKATALRGWMVGWLGETTEITVATNRGEQPSSSGSPGTHRQWRQSATNGAHTSFSLPFKRQEQQQQQQQHSSAAVASPPSLLHCIDFDSTKNRSPSHHNHRLHPTNSCHCTVYYLMTLMTPSLKLDRPVIKSQHVSYHIFSSFFKNISHHRW